MARVEIGLGAIIAGAAGLGLASELAFNVVLVAVGIGLVIHGAYDVYFKPNIFLDRTLKRWLKRRNWLIEDAADLPQGFSFGFWAIDDAKRRVLLSHTGGEKGIVAFTAPLDLDDRTLQLIGKTLSAADQQRLYEELHIVLASMHLGYDTSSFDRAAVQHAMPIDENLTEHHVDLKAKELADGVAAARSVVRKAVL